MKPKPEWGREGEVWLIEEDDPDRWFVNRSPRFGCEHRDCKNQAVAFCLVGQHGQSYWCADHMDDRWVQGYRVLAWRLRPFSPLPCS